MSKRRQEKEQEKGGKDEMKRKYKGNYLRLIPELCLEERMNWQASFRRRWVMWLILGSTRIFQQELKVSWKVSVIHVGLGDLGVTCSPRDPRFAGSNPTEIDGFFRT